MTTQEIHHDFRSENRTAAPAEQQGLTASDLIEWVRRSLGFVRQEETHDMICEAHRGIRECRRKLSDRG